MLARWAVVTRVTAAIAAVAAICASLPSIAQSQERPLVFAAASLKNALDSVNAAWKAETGKEASISYESSGNLAKQIEGGAPADIFISADLKWMKYVAEKKLTKPDTEVKLLGNGLVLVAPADSTATATIAPNFDLAGLIGDSRLAIGDIKSVPAGTYGKAALESLGVWASVEGKIAQAENVRAALRLVATGEAALGIVYTTDAKAEKAVKVLGTFPEDSHPAIVYPVAQTAESKAADAGEFLKYLQSAKARELFEAQGFTFLAPAPTN